MKISDGFLAHSDGETKLLVSTGKTDFSGLVRSNQAAGFIIWCLEQETTEDEIVSRMLEVYDASEDVLRRDVKKILGQLREIGAIDG